MKTEPKPKPMKRDQLIAALATMTHDRDEWKSAIENRDKRDSNLRQRFSTVLNAPRRDNYSVEPKTYSWEEIFFEVGKLSQDQSHIRYDDRIKNLEVQMMNIQYKQNETIPDK